MKKTETEYMDNLNNELPHKKLRQVIKKIFNHLLLKFIDYNSSKGRNRKFPKEETVHVSESSSPSFKELTLLKPIHRKSKYIMELINFQPTCKINKPEKMHIFHFKLLLRTRAFVLIAQLKTHLGMLKFSQSSQMFI